MTYLGFLGLFVGLPLLALGWATWYDARRGAGLPNSWESPAPWAVLLVHVVVAVIYTTPWDNYLVANRVWYYDPVRVSGLTLGWVPIEEYAFFVVQTLLTGLWTLWLARHLAPAAPPVRRSAHLRATATGVAGAAWFASLLLVAARWPPGTYLALILAWMLPPVVLQLAVGADVLWHHRWWVVLSLVVPMLYLSLADSVAIAGGVWTINPARSTGVLLGHVLPIEEFIFFAITNVLIVFGMALMLTAGHQLYARFVTRFGSRHKDEVRI